MKEPVVFVFKDKEKLVSGFTDFFIKQLNSTKENFNVALSGGSTPKIWFDYLAKYQSNNIQWERIHFYWGDERCVPPDDDESNFRMTKRYLFDHINIPKENIHRIKVEIDPTDAAANYINEIEKNLRKEEFPIFDLVILGMGEDGHTASIFPHEIELWDSKKHCLVATHPLSGQQRVSISGNAINAAKAVTFLVTGESKSERIKEIFNEEPGSEKYPASLVKPSKGTLHWFLDREAARFLNYD